MYTIKHCNHMVGLTFPKSLEFKVTDVDCDYKVSVITNGKEIFYKNILVIIQAILTNVRIKQ